MNILVTGAGGFIGHHLVNALVARGERVRGVDVKHPEYAPGQAHEFLLLDLRRREAAQEAVADMDEVYMLAANMGGIGFIERRRGVGVAADIVHDNTLINLLTLEAAREAGVQRIFFASSACIYPQHLQQEADVTPLKEEDAWPSDPEDGYGHEKLYAECLCRFYREDYGLETRVARFHNIYGPLGTWDGGREKSPAAIARQVALAPDRREVGGSGGG
ncbi:MAG: NAD-dependent epimerase/dehydratase family protein, partial [Anaerolineaceae bacterium]|nr:NAD-dependent epimerase/dehydratase family protein [Anaerolineaceae bacterium]